MVQRSQTLGRTLILWGFHTVVFFMRTWIEIVWSSST